MLNQLGTIPLSTDILTKANIGLWAFELDEGSAPRMYADEAMLGLIGLEHQIAPEDTYHAWYDNIDDDCYDLVTDAVEKMTNGEHAEVQYPWHHPAGYTMIVRCGGVRNFDYTKGVRIEGTHQNVTEILHFDEAERKRAEALKIELTKSKLRADALAFVADNEPDINKFMGFFGKRILEISGCDQIIYRGMDGHRIVINAPGIEDIPQDICSACPFSSFDCDAYGDDGIVLMNDCAKGFRGVHTHPDCPAKSSLMQRIYSGGELAGLLTIHYLTDYHEFTEDGVDIMMTGALYFGLLIARINGRIAERARIKAEASNTAKTAFLFNMSHDIRTPMNAILGYTDIALRHKNDSARVIDSLKKIRQSGSHLLDLINDILEMSRIESGKMVLAEDPLDLQQLIDGVVEMGRSLAIPKSIEFTTTAHDLANTYVYADQLHINEILINLISNAMKYTPEGGRVAFDVCQRDVPEGGITHYCFTVADTGMGMSEEFQKRLFEEFSREDNATIAAIEGAGLGLSIVKRIIDLAGGTIEVQSELGKGSTFTVVLPLRVMSDDEIQQFVTAQEDAEDVIEVADGLSGKRVLLVEDNEKNREIATEILEDAGLVVTCAEDGLVAVNCARDVGVGAFDFILMDIQMPVMNGYEATQQIRALPGGADVPIIALSANAFEEDRQRSLDAGMNDHVAKPIDIAALLDVLKSFA